MHQRTTTEGSKFNLIKVRNVRGTYAPTEEALERRKAKSMAALNNTVASMPALDFVFPFTGANAKTGRRGEGGGEIETKCWAHLAETCST